MQVRRKHLALLHPSQLWEQTLKFVLHPKNWDTLALESQESLTFVSQLKSTNTSLEVFGFASPIPK